MRREAIVYENVNTSLFVITAKEKSVIKCFFFFIEFIERETLS